MSNNFNRWEDLANALQSGCEQAVDATADAVVSRIQEQIEANGQVRTGEMRDGIYKISQRGSSYKNSEHALTEIPVPSSSTEADVAAAAAHSIFQNMGTVYIPPRPFFEPGMQNAASDFDKNIEQYIVKALEDAAK